MAAMACIACLYLNSYFLILKSQIFTGLRQEKQAKETSPTITQ